VSRTTLPQVERMMLTEDYPAFLDSYRVFSAFKKNNQFFHVNTFAQKQLVQEGVGFLFQIMVNGHILSAKLKLVSTHDVNLLNMWPSNHTQIYQFPEKKPSKSGLIEV
jgi:ribosomal protein L23